MILKKERIKNSAVIVCIFSFWLVLFPLFETISLFFLMLTIMLLIFQIVLLIQFLFDYPVRVILVQVAIAGVSSVAYVYIFGQINFDVVFYLVLLNLPLFFSILFQCGMFYGSLKGKRVAKRASFISNYNFPETISARIKKLHPELSDKQVADVLSALKNYFHLCSLAEQEVVAMPSKVVDDAWHEFILQTKSYQSFRREAFGYFLHHTSVDPMGKSGMKAGLRRTWQLACSREGVSYHKPSRLPTLFAIDHQLKIDEGYYYTLNKLATMPAARFYFIDDVIGEGGDGDGGGCGGGG